MEQHHTGTGDNISRDKIQNIKKINSTKLDGKGNIILQDINANDIIIKPTDFEDFEKIIDKINKEQLIFIQTIISNQERFTNDFIKTIQNELSARKKKNKEKILTFSTIIFMLFILGFYIIYYKGTIIQQNNTTHRAKSPILIGGSASDILFPEMIKIESGKYPIGQSKIFIDSFYISKYEITVQQFNEYLKAYEKDTIKDKSKNPVTNITWYETEQYCNWLFTKTNEKYRLPYEIEWEVAAKGKTTRIYIWGDEIPNKNNCNFKYAFINNATEVDIVYNISINGIVNLAGNVAEWCKDWYHSDYYGLIESNYKNGNIDLPQKTNEKVIRGGSFQDDAYDVQNTSRKPVNPERGYNNIGFRIVKLCKIKN